MVESNYDILGIPDDSSQQIVRESFRKLALQHHSDRGGDDEQFKKIKLAFEELKIGKKYPDTRAEKQRKARFYTDDLDEDKIKRNLILSHDISQEMKQAQEWAAALNRADATGIRLFGLKEMGEIELERKANKALSIKGKYWAGQLEYAGPIIMWGSITNPYFSNNEEHKTHIISKHGNFTLMDPIPNKYDIDSGAKITAENGNIIVGSVSGIKQVLPDPDGKVGLAITKEHYSMLYAPKGKIVAGNIRETVKLEADSIDVLNLVDNVKVKGRNISVYGTKVNYNVEFELLKGGSIRFHDTGSCYDISNDATIKLENGKKFYLSDLKTSGMVGFGKEITYDYLDNLGTEVKDWSFKIGFSKRKK